MQGRTWLTRAGMAVVVGLALGRVAAAGEVRLPDTGQTQSYTNIFGEDHDSRRPRSYTMNTNGTVIDNVTGLMWQRQDDNVTRDWAAVWTYCAGLTLATFTDWRLPTKQELQTLIDYGRSNPAIDSIAFPGTEASGYWSSTSDASGGGLYSWVVNFSNGYVNSYNEYNNSSSYYVRCVRSGQ